MIAFYWANDDLDVVSLETELLSVFRDDYKFDSSSFTIPVGPNTQPLLALISRVIRMNPLVPIHYGYMSTPGTLMILECVGDHGT